jgi:hypothetical protein
MILIAAVHDAVCETAPSPENAGMRYELVIDTQ